MRRLVVLGDSLTWHGPQGPLPVADERLYPNRIAAHLREATGAPWEAVVVARAGWGMRELWHAITKDVHLQQQVLVGAAAVVLGAGSVDTLPVGVPRGLLAGLPYVRPTPLRRRLRRTVERHHAGLVRATGERLRYTPISVYRHGWRKSVEAIRLFSSGAPLVGILPTYHRGPYYAASLRHHPQVRRVTIALAAELQVPLVDLKALLDPHVDNLNPDGLHWPFEMHADVGSAFAATLVSQLDAAQH